MTANGNPTQEHPQALGEQEASSDLAIYSLTEMIDRALDLAANGETEDAEDAQYALGYLERVLVECSGKRRDPATGEIVSTGFRVVGA